MKVKQRHLPGLLRGSVLWKSFWIPAFAGMTTGHLFLMVPIAQAQGLLPPTSISTATAQDISHPLLIGDKVPESLALVNDSAIRRSVLSYKSALDILVVTFLSPSCAPNKDLWPKFRKINEADRDWRVSFIVVSMEPGEDLMTLPDILKHEKIPWPVLHDGQKIAAGLFKIKATPETVIIDEFGVLRYRGPESGVRTALDRLIGHIDPLEDPEPLLVGGCPL